jgi:hypothetical protein
MSTTATWVYNSSASSTMGLDVFSDPRSTPACNLADAFAPSGARRLMLRFFSRESQPEKGAVLTLLRERWITGRLHG